MKKGKLGVTRFVTYKSGKKKGQFTKKTLDAREEYYKQLIRRQVILPRGQHVIEIRGVHYVDVFSLDWCDQKVIVEDQEGRIILLEESIKGLVSRHDIAPGVVIRLTVKNDGKGSYIARCEYLKRL